ncbi:MAG: hypothetical protein UW92_C0038G0006 [Candidatus Jorgensenbacteria bacterium GW2011_GWA2_45_13]|uniref:Uncharacterized protein n=1 Tax=Candidatus Jorgensenbacteria bacterium GW2011_GWA2_45_13 TaxID=1618662 RepID=A0A0G1L3G5_9BACT|nr:MAG: hypothetical protein UW92_C0038G0006 [Candidatus Jorgensenbacteria bacterium GW2011_GWA2_45_13]
MRPYSRNLCDTLFSYFQHLVDNAVFFRLGGSEPEVAVGVTLNFVYLLSRMLYEYLAYLIFYLHDAEARSTAPIEAAIPTQMVETVAFTCCIVS